MANINRVVLVGNLTKDPELRHTPGGTPVCSMRVAVNSRRRDESGQWVDKPNYFDVSVFGNQAESCTQYLSKGRPVGIDGRLIALGSERREGDGAGLARPARLGGVDDDAQDPCPQRGAALEAVDALEDTEPGVLDDLLRDRPRLHVVPRHGEHGRVVAFDERLERALVTRAQAREERALLGRRPVLKSGLGHRPTLTARDRASPGP